MPIREAIRQLGLRPFDVLALAVALQVKLIYKILSMLGLYRETESDPRTGSPSGSVYPFRKRTVSRPFRPQGKGDVRSPCPALNTLANHGYLPRSGRDIGPLQLIRALIDGFALSPFLAAFLTIGGFALMGQIWSLSLDDMRRHNCIEHAASLTHHSVKRYPAPTPSRTGSDDGSSGSSSNSSTISRATSGYDGQTVEPAQEQQQSQEPPAEAATDGREWAEYAPAEVSPRLWDELVKDSEDGEVLTVSDIARARVRREKADSCPLDMLHCHIAKGEIGLVLDIMGGAKRQIPIETLKHWWMNEEFPPGWRPSRRQNLLRTAWTAQLVSYEMARIRRVEDHHRKQSSHVYCTGRVREI